MDLGLGNDDKIPNINSMRREVPWDTDTDETMEAAQTPET